MEAKAKLEGRRATIAGLMVVGMIITFCFSFYHYPSQPIIGETGGKRIQKDSLASYTVHSPFNITHESNFTTLGFPGSGSKADPYRIEGLSIEPSFIGIGIYDIDCHFIIIDCWIESNSEYSFGIQLRNCSNGAVENTTFHHLVVGIDLLLVEQTIFRNNSISDLLQYGWGIGGRNLTNVAFIDNSISSAGFFIEGVAVVFGWNISVTDNTFALSTGIPVDCYYVENVIITNNEMIGSTTNFSGIGVFYSEDILIENNDVSGYGSGIAAIGTTFDIRLNAVQNCYNGIILDGVTSGRVSNNEVSDTIGEWSIISVGCNHSIISSNLISNGTTGIGFSNANNCTIGMNQISEHVFGIKICDLSESWILSQGAPSTNCKVISNTLFGCGLDFELEGSEGYYQEFSGNTVNEKELGYFYNHHDMLIDATEFGQIFLLQSENVTIVGGIFNDLGSGIVIRECDDCEVRDSIIKRCVIGVDLYEVQNCILSNISISECVGPDPSISDDYVGIQLSLSSYIEVAGCHLYENDKALNVENTDSSSIMYNNISFNAFGIYLNGANRITIQKNQIYNNTNIGIMILRDCYDGVIYENQIGWNGINAKTYSSRITWDDGESVGNYWSDWDGEGPYEISLQGEDRYPQALVTLFSYDTPFFLSEDMVILMITLAGLSAFILVVVFLSRRFLQE